MAAEFSETDFETFSTRDERLLGIEADCIQSVCRSGYMLVDVYPGTLREICRELRMARKRIRELEEAGKPASKRRRVAAGS